MRVSEVDADLKLSQLVGAAEQATDLDDIEAFRIVPIHIIVLI